jgi:transcriptional regulator with XRE-family HTH domain
MIEAMDDRTVGLVLRALRRRRGWRQRDLAARAGCSQALVSVVEAGHVSGLTIDRLRRLLAALDARIELVPRWRGADLEHLIDEAHAGVVAEVARRLERAGWRPVVEVTYSEFGERGSIDVVGLMPARRAALVVEVKTEIGSAEAVTRKVDEKARLAPRIVEARFGWRPEVIGRVLAMPESSRLRRLLTSTPILGRSFPDDAAALRRWLLQPAGVVAASWFLSEISVRNARRVDPGPRRSAGASPGPSANVGPARATARDPSTSAESPASITSADQRRAETRNLGMDRQG